MAKLIELDERVKIFAQMEGDVGPIILLNKFSVDPEEFISTMTDDLAGKEDDNHNAILIKTKQTNLSDFL
jgi:hypothetical protein